MLIPYNQMKSVMEGITFYDVFLINNCDKLIFLNFIYFYLHKSYWYGRISLSKYHISYQEWLRDWSCEARQPVVQGANSSKMIFILGDKALNKREMPSFFGKVFLWKKEDFSNDYTGYV